MADFGSISLPGRAAANQALGRSGQAIQIISLPNNLNNIAKALRLSGQITQLSSNGVIRIETPEGRIDAKINPARSSQSNLQTGQQIDIEIPAGRPPQQAILKPPTLTISNERNTPQNTSQSTSQNITTPNTTNPAPQNNITARDNYVRPEQNFLTGSRTQPIQTDTVKTPQQIQQASPLQVESTVRLLAVPPAQAQKIATDFVQTLTIQPALLTRVPVTANLIVESIQTQLLNSALQIKTPLPQQTTPNPIQNLQLSPPQILTSGLSQAVIPTPQITLAPPLPSPNQPLTILQPILNTATPLSSAAYLTPDIAQPLIQTIPIALNNTPQQPALQTPIQTSLTPAPIIFDPANPVPSQNISVSKIDIQIVSIQPPQPVISSPPNLIQTVAQIIPAATNFTPPVINPNNNAVTLTAQVTGFTPQGLPLVTLPVAGRAMPQSFVMQFNSNNLQLGSHLQITTQNPTLIGQSQTSQPSNPLLRGFQWSALNQLYSTLSQLSPQVASSLLRSLPTPVNATQIAPAAMMFIAAVKSGDIAQFIGQQKADMVQRAGRDNILRALSQDSSAPTRSTDPASSGEWRAVPLPMFWEGEIQKIMLYTRHEFQDKDKKENKGNGQTRFIFDLELSRMGEMQLDGYLKDNRLDLIIRSQNNFSPPMQQTMRQAYSHALDQTDLTGELNFQGSTKSWVHVFEKSEELALNI